MVSFASDMKTPESALHVLGEAANFRGFAQTVKVRRLIWRALFQSVQLIDHAQPDFHAVDEAVLIEAHRGVVQAGL